jgi:hypothetical protein
MEILLLMAHNNNKAQHALKIEHGPPLRVLLSMK